MASESDELVEAFERNGPLLLGNPRRPYPKKKALEAWCADHVEARESVIFQTSGSEASSKFVCLSRVSVRSSARAVNRHLSVSLDDVWLGVLPLFHVGGFSIPIRACLAGATCHLRLGPWSAGEFVETCRHVKATWTSLVPTQVFDLVEEKRACPALLRGVLVGGGMLAPALRERAFALGWPVLETYGMTETASQVATEPLGSAGTCREDRPWLEVLEGWEIDASGDSLRVRGPALFSGYVVEEGEGFRLFDPRIDGWFATRDVVDWDAEGKRLRFVSRERHVLKIKGELVNLQDCREHVAALATPRRDAVTVVPLEDLRNGMRLVLAGEERRFSEGELEMLRQRFNAGRPSFQQLAETVLLPGSLPRTALRKLDEEALKRLIQSSR